ncbi:MAG: hypothetical protein Tsb009_37900 [Planctomycetaceae bacterium]
MATPTTVPQSDEIPSADISQAKKPAPSDEGERTKADSGKRIRGLRLPVSLIAIVAVLVGSAYAFQQLAKLKKEPKQREPVVKVYNVDVFPVQLSDVPEYFPAYGSAKPDREVTIAARVSGEIVTSPETFQKLKVGQRVTAKGPLLYQIDPEKYLESLNQAKFQVAQDDKELAVLKQERENNRKLLEKAKKDVAEYRKEYERIRVLVEKKAATPSELTDARLKLQNYETALTRAQNTQDLFPLKEAQILSRRKQHLVQQRIAELDLKHTRVAANFSGTLSKVHVEPGEYVRPGDPIVTLVDSSIIEIPMALSLDDYKKIEPMIRTAESESQMPTVFLAESQSASFQWSGHVVRASPDADEVTRTIKVYVRIINEESSNAENGGGSVLPGMHYHGLIQGPTLKQVIVIPRDAITDNRVFVATELEKPVGKSSKSARKSAEKTVGNATTSKVHSGVARQRKIKVRRTFRDLAVIELGLKPGEYVILTNLDVIHDGAKVRFRQDQIRDVQKEILDPRLQDRTP